MLSKLALFSIFTSLSFSMNEFGGNLSLERSSSSTSAVEDYQTPQILTSSNSSTSECSNSSISKMGKDFLTYFQTNIFDETGVPFEHQIEKNVDQTSYNSFERIKPFLFGGIAAVTASIAYPLEVMKVCKQTDTPIIKGEKIETLKHLFAGYQASLSKTVLKTGLKFFVLTDFRKMVKDLFPEDTSEKISDFATAMCWTLFSASALTPVERIKNYRITLLQDIKGSVWNDLLKKNNHNTYKAFQELYKGNLAISIKECLGKILDLFMVAQSKDKQKEKNLSSLERHAEDAISSVQQSLISTAILMPSDSIKTLMQQCNAKNSGLIETTKEIVGRKGMIGLWSGGSFRFLGNIISNFINNKAYEVITHDEKNNF